MASIVQHIDQAAAHTPGRLAIGTDIVYGEAGAPARAETPIYAVTGGAGVACVINIGTNPATRAANARRLVAAWGICGTAPTDAIEALDKMGGVTILSRAWSRRGVEICQLRAELAAARQELAERDATITQLRAHASAYVNIALVTRLPNPGDMPATEAHPVAGQP